MVKGWNFPHCHVMSINSSSHIKIYDQTLLVVAPSGFIPCSLHRANPARCRDS